MRSAHVMDEHSENQIVVVGSGPVGMRFAEDLCRLSPTVRLHVINDERHRPYDRVRLSSLLAREVTPQALYDDLPRQLGERVDFSDGRRIDRIDRSNSQVVDDAGQVHAYDRLVLATGSRPRIPGIPGTELGGVFVFRSMVDAEKLLARQVSSRSTLVIGGGLLGLEAARAMRRFNTVVHVVEHEPHLMFNQLDDDAATRLQERVEALGIHIHVGTSVQQIVGTSTVQFVRMRDGTEIQCDTVVVATGITSNVELAREAGLSVGRGIRVNDSMQTSDPDIYAIGECCEHRGVVYGLVAPGLEQAAVAASHILGTEADYRGSFVASSLKVVGHPVFSMGEVNDSVHPFVTHSYTDEDCYRRINIFRGRVIGAAGVGAWDVARLRSVALEGHRVWPWQLARFRRTGSLWPPGKAAKVLDWPEAAIVCNCRGVSRGALTAAYEAGATDVAALSECTGAASVCGSCRPLVAEIAGGAPVREPVRKWLVGASTAGVLAAIAAVLTWLPYADTQLGGPHFDLLWISGRLKQATGFALVAVALSISLLSVRKRIRRFEWLKFASWQGFHVMVGVIGAIVLLLHTGFRFGANLNAWLMIAFVGLMATGGIAGIATALGPAISSDGLRRIRTCAFWGHVLLLWPLLPLLGFHVFKSYWF